MERRYKIKNVRVNNHPRDYVTQNHDEIWKSVLKFSIRIDDTEEKIAIREYCNKTIPKDYKFSNVMNGHNSLKNQGWGLYINEKPNQRYLDVQVVSFGYEIDRKLSLKILSNKKDCLLNLNSDIPWIKQLSLFSMKFMLT